MKTQKGFTQFIVLALVVILLLSPFFISSATGSIFGSHAREGTPAEGTGEDAGLTGPVPPSCNGVADKATAYLNRGIIYSQASPRCGGSGIGPEEMLVNFIDCSGYASRVYRDAGLLMISFCQDTVGLAVTSALVKVTGNSSEAQSLAEPGDIILTGLRYTSSSGVEKIEACGGERGCHSVAHAVIYAGGGHVYESGWGNQGPHYSAGTVWTRFNRSPFFGLYRAKNCSGSTSEGETT
jgi:hypothetical protein